MARRGTSTYEVKGTPQADMTWWRQVLHHSKDGIPDATFALTCVPTGPSTYLRAKCTTRETLDSTWKIEKEHRPDEVLAQALSDLHRAGRSSWHYSSTKPLGRRTNLQATSSLSFTATRAPHLTAADSPRPPFDEDPLAETDPASADPSQHRAATSSSSPRPSPRERPATVAAPPTITASPSPWSQPRPARAAEATTTTTTDLMSSTAPASFAFATPTPSHFDVGVGIGALASPTPCILDRDRERERLVERLFTAPASASRSSGSGRASSHRGGRHFAHLALSPREEADQTTATLGSLSARAPKTPLPQPHRLSAGATTLLAPKTARGLADSTPTSQSPASRGQKEPTPLPLPMPGGANLAAIGSPSAAPATQPRPTINRPGHEVSAFGFKCRFTPLLY